MWNNFADSEAAVSGGRGASAQDDWDANKTITAPDFQDRVAMGVSSGGSITTVGATAGATTVASAGTNGVTGGHALTAAENGPHTHTLDLYGNNPAVTNFAASSNSVLGGSATTASSGSGTPHTHPGSTFTGTPTSVVQKSIGIYWYLRVLGS